MKLFLTFCRYKLGRVRAFEKEKAEREAQLDRELYKPRKGCVERERFKHKETGHDMRYGNRTANERVKEVVEFNKMKDHAFQDTKMIHFPDWRDDNKRMRKGKSAVEFSHYRNHFGLKTETAWRQLPLRENKEDFDPYVNGLEHVGTEHGLRKRERSKEVRSWWLIVLIRFPKKTSFMPLLSRIFGRAPCIIHRLIEQRT